MISPKVSTLLLRAVIIVAGALVFTFFAYLLPGALREDEVVYQAILVALYSCLLPFFYVLHQSLRLLSYIDKNKIFSTDSIRRLTSIKYGGAAIAGIATIALPFVATVGQQEDAPGVMVLGMFVIAAAIVVAAAALILQQLVQHAIDIKAENDLTV